MRLFDCYDMRSRMLVRFHPDIVTLYVRVPRRHEQDSLESFECHAAGCVTCYHLLSPSSTAVPLCNEGHSKATTLRQLLYAEHGRIYAKPRERVHPKVIVEAHPLFCIARRVLCATERTRRLSPNIEALQSCIQLTAKACVKLRQTLQCQCSGCGRTRRSRRSQRALASPASAAGVHCRCRKCGRTCRNRRLGRVLACAAGAAEGLQHYCTFAHILYNSKPY